MLTVCQVKNNAQLVFFFTVDAALVRENFGPLLGGFLLSASMLLSAVAVIPCERCWEKFPGLRYYLESAPATSIIRDLSRSHYWSIVKTYISIKCSCIYRSPLNDSSSEVRRYCQSNKVAQTGHTKQNHIVRRHDKP